MQEPEKGGEVPSAAEPESAVPPVQPETEEVMCGACGYLLRDLPNYCPRCGIKFQAHTAWPAKCGNSKHTSELIGFAHLFLRVIIYSVTSSETVRRMIGQILKVSITDGRVFVGRFVCFDKQSNIILGECREYRRVQLVASEPGKIECTRIPNAYSCLSYQPRRRNEMLVWCS